MHLSNNSSAKMLLKEAEIDHFTRFCVGSHMISRVFWNARVKFFQRLTRSMKNLQALFYSELFEFPFSHSPFPLLKIAKRKVPLEKLLFSPRHSLIYKKKFKLLFSACCH